MYQKVFVIQQIFIRVTASSNNVLILFNYVFMLRKLDFLILKLMLTTLIRCKTQNIMYIKCAKKNNYYGLISSHSIEKLCQCIPKSIYDVNL